MSRRNSHACCRPRSLTSSQYHLLSLAITKRGNAVVGEGDEFEPLRRRGMLKLLWEVRGFRRYDVTEKGAAMVQNGGRPYGNRGKSGDSGNTSSIR
jgi:hypothetical protein